MESGPSGLIRSRSGRVLLGLGLGGAAFLLPHWFFVIVSDAVPYLQRELTLLPTLGLSAIGAFIVTRHAPPFLALVSTSVGLLLGMVTYIITTTETGAPQLWGAVSPAVLWAIALAAGLLLVAPGVLVGVVLGVVATRRRSPC